VERAELLDQLLRPESRSSVLRVEIIRAVTNLECAATCTQHRKQPAPAILEWDLPRREPGITLRGVARRSREPVRGVDRAVLGSQPSHMSRNQGDRLVPLDPLRDHRRRHRRVLRRNALTRPSNGVNDVGCAGSSYFGGRPGANALSTADRPIPQLPCDLPLRNHPRRAADRCPVSTEIIHSSCLRGLVFARRYGLTFERRRHESARGSRGSCASRTERSRRSGWKGNDLSGDHRPSIGIVHEPSTARCARGATIAR
jgi:hypothetical protein